MAQQPEEVLVEPDAAALDRVEEGRVHQAVGHRQDLGVHVEGEGVEAHRGRGKTAVDEYGRARPGHALGPHGEDRRHDVDAREGGGHGEDDDGGLVADHAGTGLCIEWLVDAPPIPDAAHEERQDQRGHRAHEEPDAQGIEAREGHVTRTAHERDDEVAHRAGDDHDHRDDHGDAMGTHQGVVEVGVEDFHPRNTELRADEHGEQAAEAEDDHRHDEVLDADDLVVGGEAPVAERALVLAGQEFGIGVREIAAEQPADGSDERPHAAQEADDPADHHRPERRTGRRVGEVGRDGTGGELAVHDEAEDEGEDDAAHQAGEEVEMADEATGLAMLLRLRDLNLIDQRRAHGIRAHEVLPPPDSRMTVSKVSDGSTRISVSM